MSHIQNSRLCITAEKRRQ